MAVPDDDLRDAQRSLAAAEGVFGEPSGAVGMAALAGMLDEGAILPGETVVAVVTGGGFRDVSSARIRVTEPTVIDDSLEGLRRSANQLYPLLTMAQAPEPPRNIEAHPWREIRVWG